MKTSSIAIVASALISGFAAGWLCKPQAPAAKGRPDGASGRQARIAEPHTRIRTVTSVVTNTVMNTVTNTVKVQERRDRGPGGFMADLERMKEEDPERYSATTNRMARFRERMMQRTESRLETLSSISTEGWSRHQIATHEKYQDLIARREALLELLNPSSGATPEERESAMQELFKLGRELHSVGERERNTLLEKTFSGLGYSQADALEIVDTIKTIYSTTQDWGGPHGGGRRGGPPPPQ